MNFKLLAELMKFFFFFFVFEKSFAEKNLMIVRGRRWTVEIYLIRDTERSNG